MCLDLDDAGGRDSRHRDYTGSTEVTVCYYTGRQGNMCGRQGRSRLSGCLMRVVPKTVQPTGIRARDRLNGRRETLDDNHGTVVRRRRRCRRRIVTTSDRADHRSKEQPAQQLAQSHLRLSHCFASGDSVDRHNCRIRCSFPALAGAQPCKHYMCSGSRNSSSASSRPSYGCTRDS